MARKVLAGHRAFEAGVPLLCGDHAGRRVYTGYYNADATDKAVIAHNIQADITMDIIRTNAAIIKNMIEHCEEDE